MEILLNEGTGGDGADVTFIKEGAADPTQTPPHEPEGRRDQLV